jgi:lantibiotic biosynthesis protein
VHLIECIFPLIANRGNQINTRDYANFIETNETARMKLPGSEWLYVKLYGLSGRENEFIRSELREFISNGKELGHFKKCFFIRYRDPEQHIRIRFQGQPQVLIERLLPNLLSWIQSLRSRGFVSKMVIDTYDPEIERYGGIGLIKDAESVFAADSEMVIELLDYHYGVNPPLDIEVIGVLNIIEILNGYTTNKEQLLNLLDKHVNYKNHLFDFRQKRKEYHKLYEELMSSSTSPYSPVYHILRRRRDLLQSYFHKLTEITIQNPLIFENTIFSIIHMSHNRLFGINRDLEIKILTLARHTIYQSVGIEKNKKQKVTIP